MMRGTIQRWGNSQGLRIPKSMLTTARLRENDPVEITATKQCITIRKLRRPQSLNDLFAHYEGSYVPQELDSGADVGREVLE